MANQLQLLGIFISASTVRNILQRPKPRNTPVRPATAEQTEETPESRSIPAWYPNHVWSVETTRVLCWSLRPIQLLVAIDRSSRKVVCAVPLEGPSAGWIIEDLEQTLHKRGAPWQNGYAESFHSRVRDELLDAELFRGLRDAKALAASWKNEYNHRRPHSSLGYQTPAAYAATQADPPVGPTGLPPAQPAGETSTPTLITTGT